MSVKLLALENCPPGSAPHFCWPICPPGLLETFSSLAKSQRHAPCLCSCPRELLLSLGHTSSSLRFPWLSSGRDASHPRWMF